MSKTLIVLMVGLLAVGCASTPTMKNVAGTYELKVDVGSGYKEDNFVIRFVFLDNGVYGYWDGDKDMEGKEGKWSIVDGEIHLEEEDGGISIGIINPDGSITGIAEIDDGKREDIPKEDQLTFKKISSSTIKPLVRPHTNDTDTSPTMKSVAGTYVGTKDGGTAKVVLLDNGVLESYRNGEKEEEGLKWKIVDGEIHVGKEKESVVVIRVNKDGSLTTIAEIRDGKRTDYPKDFQLTLKKIK